MHVNRISHSTSHTVREFHLRECKNQITNEFEFESSATVVRVAPLTLQLHVDPVSSFAELKINRV